MKLKKKKLGKKKTIETASTPIKALPTATLTKLILIFIGTTASMVSNDVDVHCCKCICHHLHLSF